MGVVAAQTPLVLLHGFVLEFYLIRQGTDVLMALDTEGIAGFVENKGVIGSVGVVAGDTVAFNDDFVGAAGLIRHHFLVAAAAQRIDIRY